MADVPAFHSAGRSAWHGDGPGTRRLDLELDEDEPSSDFEDLFSDENLVRAPARGRCRRQRVALLPGSGAGVGCAGRSGVVA